MAGCVGLYRKGMETPPVLFPSTSRQRCKSELLSSYSARFCGVFIADLSYFCIHHILSLFYIQKKKKKYEFPVYLEKQSKPFSREITNLATVQHKNRIKSMRKFGNRYTNSPT